MRWLVVFDGIAVCVCGDPVSVAVAAVLLGAAVVEEFETIGPDPEEPELELAFGITPSDERPPVPGIPKTTAIPPTKKRSPTTSKTLCSARLLLAELVPEDDPVVCSPPVDGAPPFRSPVGLVAVGM